MTLNFSPATARTLLCLAALLCLVKPTAALEIKARLDTNSIRLGETVRLTLEADAQPAPGPDLSPLQQHFRIVGSSSSRQIREINGQRAERHELHLTLSPLHAGRLEIPAIAFGEFVTQPLSLEVSANSEVSAYADVLAPVANRPPANTRPPGDASTSSRPAGGYPEMPPPTSAPSITTQTTYPPPPETKPWWLLILASWPALGVLGAILGVTGLIWKWRQRWQRVNHNSRPQDRPRPPSSPSPTPPTSFQADPLVTAITAVQRAYAAGDAATARDALLAWAALALPDHPPANLALLAKRCQEPLRSDILLLEQTFFSPRPVDWNHRQTWEHLPDFVPLPPDQPVFFRQKTPLRRPPRTQPANW